MSSIEHFIELGPEKTGQVADALDMMMRGYASRHRPLDEDERADYLRVIDDWEVAQIACLAFAEADELMDSLRARRFAK